MIVLFAEQRQAIVSMLYHENTQIDALAYCFSNSTAPFASHSAKARVHYFNMRAIELAVVTFAVFASAANHLLPRKIGDYCDAPEVRPSAPLTVHFCSLYAYSSRSTGNWNMPKDFELRGHRLPLQLLPKRYVC